MNIKTGQAKFYTYLVVISILAFAVLVHSFLVTDLKTVNIQAIIFFVLISIVTASMSIELPKGGYISVNFIIDLTCIVTLGPNVAIWIAAGSELLKKDTLARKVPLYKTVFNCSEFILSVWLAGMAYLVLGGEINSSPISAALPLTGAVLTYFFVNSGAVTIALALLNNTSMLGIWLTNIRGVTPSVLALTPLGLLMASMYNVAGIWGVSLFFIPLLLARYMFKAYTEVSQNYLDTLGALASALDAKDRYTRGHSDRVAAYAVAIARGLKLPEDKIEIIEHMALLHDIGKIGISGEILTKPGRLSEKEFDQIKQHPVISANILKNIKDLEPFTDMVRYHHEKFNGTGYPFGLKGEEIPLEARIITLADSFDAMTSDRAYRKAMNIQEAFDEVRRSSGSHFDPIIVDTFINNWETGGLCDETFNNQIAARSIEKSE